MHPLGYPPEQRVYPCLARHSRVTASNLRDAGRSPSRWGASRCWLACRWQANKILKGSTAVK